MFSSFFIMSSSFSIILPTSSAISCTKSFLQAPKSRLRIWRAFVPPLWLPTAAPDGGAACRSLICMAYKYDYHVYVYIMTLWVYESMSICNDMGCKSLVDGGLLMVDCWWHTPKSCRKFLPYHRTPVAQAALSPQESDTWLKCTQC